MKGTDYIAYPITLHKGALPDFRLTADGILNYCGFAVASQLERGTPAERMKAAGDHLGITWGNINTALKEGKELHQRTLAKTPMTSIRKPVLWDYYSNDKTEFEIACLLAFAAIKSILGNKPFCKTNKALIHARMFGYRSAKDMPEVLEGYEAKYAKRWHMDRLLKELQFSWSLKVYTNHCYGIYVCFGKANKKDMVRVCLEKKSKNKEKRLQAENGKLTAEVSLELDTWTKL
jgi:hypothetical protein